MNSNASERNLTLMTLLTLRPGFFQTGLTTAVECDVLLPDGSPACKGGELCVGGDPSPSCNGAFGDLDMHRATNNIYTRAALFQIA